jgi:hypothetical protein
MFGLSHNLSKSNLVPSSLARFAAAKAEFSCGAVDPNKTIDIVSTNPYRHSILQ